MENSSGNAYGLTVLSPIRNGPAEGPSHADLVRAAVAAFAEGAASPLAQVNTTHMARLAVLDDVFYQAFPAAQDHLKSKYLFFSTNFDGKLADYLELMRTRIPEDVDGVWKHCVNFPGTRDAKAFHEYFKRCQVGNAIFFADYPDATVSDVLRALDTQSAFVDFIVRNQQTAPEDLKDAFDEFMAELGSRPQPAPGSI